jgi:hypothetical protein
MTERACASFVGTAFFLSVAALALPAGCGGGGGSDTGPDDDGMATDGADASSGSDATESTTGPSTTDPTSTTEPTSATKSPTDPTDPTEAGTDTDDVEQGDRVVLQTGEFVDRGEVGRIAAWGMAEDNTVGAEISWVEDGAVQGDALVRWHEDDDTLEALASPSALVDAFGSSELLRSVFDAAGFIAFENEFSCVGMWDGQLDEKICVSDPELEPGGFLSLGGMFNGTALVTIQRNSDEPRFEFYGVDATEPRVRYALRNDTVDNVNWEVMEEARDGIVMPGGGVLMQVGGRTPTVEGASGILMSELEGTAEVVTHLYGQGAQGFTGVFPGAPTFPNELVPNNGNVYRGMVVNDEGVVAFTYTPTETNGTLADNAGIYSVVPGSNEFSLHHLFSDTLTSEAGASEIELQGNTPALPSMAFGLTNEGLVVMSATLRNGSSGIYREIAPGEFIDLASTGATAPDDAGVPMDGTTYAAIGSVVVGTDGSLMYTARIEGPGIDSALLGLGVWGVAADEGFEPQPRLLAKIGDPLPGDGKGEIFEIRVGGLLLPDSSGSAISGLGLNRTIENSFNTSGFGLQAFGAAGSSQTIRPGACADGLVLVSDGSEDVLMLKELDPTCVPG